MDKREALEELEKLLDEYAEEIESGNETHFRAYQAIGVALVLIDH